MAGIVPNQRAIQPALREQIIEAASLCFERNGIRSTGMQEVADAVGVSRQTVYSYFANKSALICEVSLTFARACYKDLLRELDYSGSAGEIIAAANGGLTRRFRSSRGRMLLNPADRDILVPIMRGVGILDIACAEYWAPILERLRDGGKIRADIDIREAAKWLYLLNFAYNQVPDLDGIAQQQLDQAFTAPGLSAAWPDHQN